MAEYGLLIDYEWCSGCHTCEVACQMEHELPTDQYGIKILDVGPWKYEAHKWVYGYMPFPTDQCDLCADRTSKGKLPTCVHHCQATCMKYGTLQELENELAKKPKQTLFALS